MQMMKAFIKYDQDFEYGADLPEIFIRLVHQVTQVEPPMKDTRKENNPFDSPKVILK